jgi:hypothetical protein
MPREDCHELVQFSFNQIIEFQINKQAGAEDAPPPAAINFLPA